MYLLLAYFFIGAPAAAADDAGQILQQVRETVAAQIKKSANYTCVQTIDRTYFKNSRDLLPGCAYESQTPARKETMHDRLRLDVAVSEGQEIYSWHGENNFSSSAINSVVKSGPISSGGFIGFLHNIFLDAGVQFSYTGRSVGNGVAVHAFAYTVPVASSRYHVQSKHGSPIVPFHGSFSVDATSFELASLTVVADGIPNDSSICSAETEVDYQIARISGRDSLIPSRFLLRIDDSSHIYTVSRNEYAQCREFRGESTLRFDLDDTGTQAAPKPVAIMGWLPAGITLRIGMRSPIDEKTAFTGDSIEGVLLDSAKLPGTQTTIPKGALLKGIITELEEFYDPGKYYFVRIEFRRLTFGNSTYLLNGLHKPVGTEGDKLYFLFGKPLPAPVTEELREGTIVFDSRHFRLDHRFSGEWETSQPPDATPSAHP